MPSISENQNTLLGLVKQALQGPEDSVLKEILADRRVEDIAEVFVLLSDEDRSRVIFALTARLAAEMLTHLDEATRGDVIEDLEPKEVSDLVTEMPVDDAVDMLGEMELTEQETSEILENVDDDKAEKIERLLQYDEDTAGGIMDPDIVTIDASLTVGEAVRAIRDRDINEEIFEACLVDESGGLVGLVPLNRLVIEAKQEPVSSVADMSPMRVRVDQDQEEVVQKMMKYDLHTLPVVDESNRVVGQITFDDVYDVIEAEAAEDMFQMAGTSAAERESSSVFRAVSIRMRWLYTGMCVTLGSAAVAGYLEPLFRDDQFKALMLFIPMVAALGGNCGIQIATVIIRGFAEGDLASDRFGKAIIREARIVPLLALCCAVFAYILVQAFFPVLQMFSTQPLLEINPGRVALSVFLGIFLSLMAAGAMGVILPFAFRKLGVDPAVAAGPLVTSLNDLISVSTYLLVAMQVVR